MADSGIAADTSAIEANVRGGNVPCVLLYHEVSVRPHPLLNRFMISVHPKVLQVQLRTLHERFQPIGLPELLDCWSRGESVRHRVMVTFDDGYAMAVEHAAGALATIKMPSLWFVNSGLWCNTKVFWLSRMMWVEDVGLLQDCVRIANRRWPGLLAPCPSGDAVNGWAKTNYSRTFDMFLDEYCDSHGCDTVAAASAAALFAGPATLRALARVAEIGNHTASHPNVANIALADVRQEIDACDAAIRCDVGVIPRTFAFPFGEAGRHWGPSAVALLSDHGYRLIFSVDSGARPMSSDRWGGVIPRHAVPPEPVTASEFHAYVEGLLLRRKEIGR